MTGNRWSKEGGGGERGWSGGTGGVIKRKGSGLSNFISDLGDIIARCGVCW